MAAPKGNQYALGCKNAGVPRSVSFSKEKMIELGKEMVEWVNAHPDILHLSQWYTIEKMFVYKQWKAFTQCEEFLPYYELALKLVGQNYLSKNSNVEPSLKQRWARVYFADLRNEEEETLDKKLERDKELATHKAIADAKVVDEQIKETMNALMDMFKNGQVKKSKEIEEK